MSQKYFMMKYRFWHGSPYFYVLLYAKSNCYVICMYQYCKKKSSKISKFKTRLLLSLLVLINQNGFFHYFGPVCPVFIKTKTLVRVSRNCEENSFVKVQKSIINFYYYTLQEMSFYEKSLMVLSWNPSLGSTIVVTALEKPQHPFHVMNVLQ